MNPSFHSEKSVIYNLILGPGIQIHYVLLSSLQGVKKAYNPVTFEMTYLYKAGCHSSNILEFHLQGFWFLCPLNTSCSYIQVLFWSQWGHNHLLPNTLQFIIHQSFCHGSYIISVTTSNTKIYSDQNDDISNNGNPSSCFFSLSRKLCWWRAAVTMGCLQLWLL